MRDPRRIAIWPLLLVLASCAGESFPVPRLPQVEQTTEAVYGRGERYRAHRTCVGSTRAVEDLIRCMHDAGWEFVARRPGYPEADCWAGRDRSELDRVLPECFFRTQEQRGGGESPR
jgi:hypothetical protein